MSYIGVVNTKYGAMSGVELNGQYEGITMFKGIPFAAPPVGELRWKPPVDPQSWVGVRECTNYGPVCTQPTNGDLDSEPWASDFYYMGGFPMSEDCLYLNVTTGAVSADEKRPVFVWFHGGGSDHGYSYEIEFDPREMAKKGVVVVSVAQRLSMFGYLSLPQLDAEQGGKSGNYILMDDLKALEWIIENIAAFGGDPECITVGGQSAGTFKSSTVAHSKLAVGHVKRVINQSSLVWSRGPKNRADAQKEYADYLTAIGIDPTLPVEELRKIDALQFLPHGQAMRIPGSLVVDGDLVPYDDMTKTIDDYTAGLDYLAGSNLGETHMKMGSLRGSMGYTSPEEFYADVREMIGDLYDKYDFENLVPVTAENVDRESRRLASLGLAHGGPFGSGGLSLNRRFGEYRVAKAPGKTTYTYLFSRIPPMRAEEAGTDRDANALMAWHSGELWYTFASLREGVPPARPWEQIDFDLAEKVNNYWVNFIKTGNPNGEGLPVWPASDENRGYIELGEEIVPHAAPEKIDELIIEYLERKKAFPR